MDNQFRRAVLAGDYDKELGRAHREGMPYMDQRTGEILYRYEGSQWQALEGCILLIDWTGRVHEYLIEYVMPLEDYRRSLPA